MRLQLLSERSPAARRIIEMEALLVESPTFKVCVEANFCSDADALDHLEYQGRHASYLIKRQAV